jgi:hypothetical protein
LLRYLDRKSFRFIEGFKDIISIIGKTSKLNASNVWEYLIWIVKAVGLVLNQKH